MKSQIQALSLGPLIFVIAVAAVTASPVAAGDDSDVQPLFRTNDVLRVQIEAPFTTLMRDRNSDEYQDGLFHVITESGTGEALEVKIRTRGNYRRREENCEFAPLRLNFLKEQVRGTILEGQDKLKLVTHCDNSRRSYEQSVVLEYLAYRILNELTSLSFRARLLHVDYIDTERDNKTHTKFAILIEEEESLYRRIDMQFAAIGSVTPEQLDPQQTTLIGVFQYLIGNTDFSPLRGAKDEFCCHNVVLVSTPGTALMPIPYDFDLSGLVDAPYASPNPKLKIKKVTQRLYRGYCMHNEQLPGVIDRMTENRDAIASLVEHQEGLLAGSRATASRYIDKFYDRVSAYAEVEKNLIRECL
jgi:hypothetical protein